MMTTNLSKRQIIDVLENFHEQLIEPGLELASRQPISDGSLRMDILFKDSQGKYLFVDLPKSPITADNIHIASQYRKLIKTNRILIAASSIDADMKEVFDNSGIEFLEYDPTEIKSLHQQIEKKKKEQNLNVIGEYKTPQNIIKAATSSNSERDGNLAFKVTYTDSNWSGVCSREVAEYNFSKKDTWCAIQQDDGKDCQSEKYADPENLSLDNAPCHDCIAQKELFFYPGHSHGEKHNNKPKKCLHAKKGKIAVFTSRENGESEDERFIFAIGQMNEFREVQDYRGNYEHYFCDKDTAIIFNTSRPKFWKYYSNANNPDREAWNSLLFRYLDDAIVSDLLIDIMNSRLYPNKVKGKAKYLLEQLYKSTGL